MMSLACSVIFAALLTTCLDAFGEVCYWISFWSISDISVRCRPKCSDGLSCASRSVEACPVNSAVVLMFFLDRLQHVSTFRHSISQYRGRFAILCVQSFNIQHHSLLPLWHASLSWSVLHFSLVQLHCLPFHARLLPHFRSYMCEF